MAYDIDRYKFYLNFLDFISDPEQKHAKSVFTVLARNRKEHETIQENIDRIARSINLLRSSYTRPDYIGGTPNPPSTKSPIKVVKNDLNEERDGIDEQTSTKPPVNVELDVQRNMKALKALEGDLNGQLDRNVMGANVQFITDPIELGETLEEAEEASKRKHLKNVEFGEEDDDEDEDDEDDKKPKVAPAGAPAASGADPLREEGGEGGEGGGEEPAGAGASSPRLQPRPPAANPAAGASGEGTPPAGPPAPGASPSRSPTPPTPPSRPGTERLTGIIARNRANRNQREPWNSSPGYPLSGKIGRGGSRGGEPLDIIRQIGGSYFSKRLDELNVIMKKKGTIPVRDQEVMEDDVVLEYENNALYNPDLDKVTFTDKLVFIGMTFALRAITLVLLNSAIQTQYVKTFTQAFSYYFGIYTLLFLIWVMIVNLRKEDYIPGLMFYYVNANYDVLVWKRIVIHIVIQALVLPLPILLTPRFAKTSETDTFEKRESMYNTLTFFTFVIWIITSLAALKV